MFASIEKIMRWIDWPLTVTCGGFAVVAWWGQRALIVPAEAGEPSAPKQKRDQAHLAYEAAIAKAAVKHPGYAVRLKTIPATATTVTVVTVGPPGPIAAKSRSFEIWAALPDELRDACKGAAKPARRLQEILGMPPVELPTHVVRELQVPRDGLFRPCVAGGDLASPYCALELSAEPAPHASSAAPGASVAPPVPPVGSVVAPVTSGKPGAPAASAAPKASADVKSAAPAAPGSSAYDDLYFSMKQMWSTYRIDFLTRRSQSGDYPYTGFPFTGMGWSYDWSDVPNHIGVSEFVVRRDAVVTELNTKTPAEFCQP